MLPVRLTKKLLLHRNNESSEPSCNTGHTTTVRAFTFGTGESAPMIIGHWDVLVLLALVF